MVRLHVGRHAEHLDDVVIIRLQFHRKLVHRHPRPAVELGIVHRHGDLHEMGIDPVEPFLDLHFLAHRPAGLIQPHPFTADQADGVDDEVSRIHPSADRVSVPPEVRELLGEFPSVGPDDAVALVELVHDDDLVLALNELRVTQLIEVGTRKAQGVALIPRIVAQRGQHGAVAVERLVAVVDLLALSGVGRLALAVAGHGRGTIGLDAGAWTLCRLPHPVNIPGRRGTGRFSRKRVRQRAAPAIEDRQVRRGHNPAATPPPPPPRPCPPRPPCACACAPPPCCGSLPA